jgi:hypothetical protein
MPTARPWSSGSRSASTAGWSGCRGARSQRLLTEWPTCEQRTEAYYLQRTRFENITGWKLRRRQLAEDGNVEISGRDPCQLPIADVRRASAKPPQPTQNCRWDPATLWIRSSSAV